MTGGKKVLVVDDDVDIREIIKLILDMEGFQVSELDNGSQVEETVQRWRPDVVLLDVLLGDMDGRDICKRLKSAPETQAIPVIIVSGTHGSHTRYEKNCMADDYLGKPFDIADLVDRVRRYVA